MIAGRAFWLQGVQGARLASEAAYQQTGVVTVPGLRGSLLDRYGNALAASEDAATVYATPYQVKDPPRTAAKLARVLGMGGAEVLRSLTAALGLLLRRPRGERAGRRRGSPASIWPGSASFPTAGGPTRRASWRLR